MKQLSTEFTRGYNPENCNSARDKQVYCQAYDILKDFDTPTLEHLASWMEFYNEKIPQIERPNCTINADSQELLAHAAPGFDINSLNHAISDIDYRHLTDSETKKEELIRRVGIGTLPFIYFVLPPLMLAATHKDWSIRSNALVMLVAGITACGTVALSVQARINALTDRTQSMTEKQIANELQEFIRSENINLNY